MKFGKKELNLLMMVAGVLIFIVGYFVFYNDYNTKKDNEIKARIPLDARLKELKDFQDNRPKYDAGMKEAADRVKEIVTYFPPMTRVEDSIMYSMGIDNETSVSYQDGEFIRIVPLFNAEGELGNMANITQMSFGAPVYLMQFKARPEIGMKEDATFDAYMMTTELGISNIWYDDMKRTIRYLNYSPFRTFINSVTVSFNSNTGSLSGSIMYTQVYMNDGTYEYVPTVVPDGEYGVYNPFKIEK